MPSETQPIKCGKCKVHLEIFAEPDGSPMFRCPGCGVTENLDNVMREFNEFLEEQAAKGFQGILRNAARGKKFLKFKPGVIRKREHRFVADLD